MFIFNILLITYTLLSYTTLCNHNAVGFIIVKSNFAFHGGGNKKEFNVLDDDDGAPQDYYHVKKKISRRKKKYYHRRFQRFDNTKTQLYNDHHEDNIQIQNNNSSNSNNNETDNVLILHHQEEEEQDLHLFWNKIRSPSFDYIQIQNTLPPSLSHLLSTPQRYAISLNKTIEEVQEIKRHFQYSVDEYRKQRRLEQDNEMNQVDTTTTTIIGNSSSRHDDDVSIRNTNRGKKEHELQCEIRYKYGRDPFVCPKCWTHEPICICQRAQSISQTISPPLFLPAPNTNGMNILQKVIIWTHHDEWGKTSNSGYVIGVTLGEQEWCHVWMKGLKMHDEYMKQLLDDDMIVPIVLWPNLNGKIENDDFRGDDDDDRWTTIEELKQYMNTKKTETRKDASNQECIIVMIAIEGTWRNARRMIKKLPSHVKRLDIGEYLSVISNNNNNKKLDNHDQQQNEEGSSILQPLRSQGDGSSKASVCTAEAIVAALVQFGLPLSDGMKLLELTQIKVDLTVRYQGKKII